MATTNPNPKQSHIDGVTFVDAENYMGGKDPTITYEQIVLMQIKRCVEEGSKEMSGGYMKEKMTNKGMIEIYVPDQRQVYIQCINSLYDLMLPHFDEEIHNQLEYLEKRYIESKEDKIANLKLQIARSNDRRIIEKLKQQIITGYLDRDSLEARQLADELLELYRELYQELILLYTRKRFLLSESISD